MNILVLIMAAVPAWWLVVQPAAMMLLAELDRAVIGALSLVSG